MYKCILCCWWTENLSVVIGLIDEVIKNTRIFKWRSILRNIMPHMYMYPKCAIIDNISIYIHYDIFYFHAHVYEGVDFILWWQNLNFKFLPWQTTVTTKETVQVTTLEPKENDLSEEEDIQYGESVVLYIWLEICIHFRVCLLEGNLKMISSIFYWFLLNY